MITGRFIKKLAVAAVGLVALLVAAAPADGATSAIVVKSYSVNGGIVQVTVQNTSSVPVSGTIAVQAVVNGTASWSFVPFAITGGQCASVSAAFTGPVTKVTSAGLADEGTPI